MGDLTIVRRGGGTSLNFKFVGGTTQPDATNANLIWVNTDVDITGWIFTNEMPTNVSPGMVWVSVGRTSPGAFNLLKKGELMVYPVAAKQYIDGEFVQKAAKTCVNGVWQEWLWSHAYNKGDICEALTSGWEAIALRTSGQNYPVKPTVTFNDDSMQIQQSSSNYASGIVYTLNKIDITPYSSVSAVVTATKQNHQAASCSLKIFSEIGVNTSENMLAQSAAWQTTTGVYRIDTSGINDFAHIALSPYWGIVCTITEIRLEV